MLLRKGSGASAPKAAAIRIVVVGDREVGKTSLLRAYLGERFVSGYIPTETPLSSPSQLEPFSMTLVKVDNELHPLELFDTSGEMFDYPEDICRFPHADIFFLCIDVASPETANNARDFWMPEIKKWYPNTPIILVGTRVDLRDDGEKRAKQLMTVATCERLAVSMATWMYLECSALTTVGVQELLTKALNVHVFSLRSPPTPRKQVMRRSSTLALSVSNRLGSLFSKHSPTLFKSKASPPPPTTPSRNPSPSFGSATDASSFSFNTRPRGNSESSMTSNGVIDIAPIHSNRSWSESESTPRATAVFTREGREYSYDMPFTTTAPTLSNISIPNPSSSSPSSSSISSFRSLHRRLVFYSDVSVAVSSTTGNSPTLDWTHFIEKESTFSIGGGRFGDVYRGVWIDVPRPVSSSTRLPKVVIKVIRPLANHQERGGQRALRHLRREIAVWQVLEHENIVPFLGISNRFGLAPSLISVWMANGSANAYLERSPEVDRVAIIRGIARGLKYLHSQDPEICHGDLKAVNILIDDNGNACISDFGLSRIIDDTTLWATTATSAPGSIRWMSPELINGEQLTVHTPSDVYAYAMTSLEIMTDKVPFSQYSKDGAVMTAVALRKERPKRPMVNFPPISDSLWSLWETCWREEPSQRPNMVKVVEGMEKIYQEYQRQGPDAF